jgi:hypothetical protein
VINDPADDILTFEEALFSAIVDAWMLPVFNNPPNSIEVRGSIIRIVGDV